MKSHLAAIGIVVLSSMADRPCSAQADKREHTVAVLDNGARVSLVKTANGWGIAVQNAQSASVQQLTPVSIEFNGSSQPVLHNAGYRSVKEHSGGFMGTAQLFGPDKSRFDVEDRWSATGDVLSLDRRVTVHGTSDRSFTSNIRLEHPGHLSRNNVEYFAPGMIYGSFAHLTPAAIGGRDTYEQGKGIVQIREDRLPAPMFGVHFRDGSAMTLVDVHPNGESTRADSYDFAITELTDEHFHFGGIGGSLTGGLAAEIFGYPGSEGEVTYLGNRYPGGQEHRWRRRYHPIRDGLVQHYNLAFRFSQGEPFPTYTRNAWRWAYATLRPIAQQGDLATIERNIVDVLASETVTVDTRTGIPNSASAVAGPENSDRKAILGFCGKNLEAAEFLLAEADRETDAKRAKVLRRLGLAIFESFLKLKVDPPAGEGFYLDTGRPALAIERDQCVYLRSFSDDMKATLRAYIRERKAGRLHPEWLTWAQGFADWLLTQQATDGSFPRSWKPHTGKVADPSPQSSYNPIPFFVLLNLATSKTKYLASAEHAGEYVWNAGQENESFVGGTIDNPDVLDKEAGTLSLEAYLALFGATHSAKWLERARAAADYAETYIYLWNVPMPADTSDASLQWKRKASTVGTQLIATGHSLVDEYMAFDVASYARLSRETGDPHYLDVARLLLHGTKGMIATPTRLYDLRGPGWQQEHWSLAPPRGLGLHRLWLPWVATSQLRGMIELRELDGTLYSDLAGTAR